MQGANTDARWRDKCKVRAPMQDGGANTNANSNGPKWQRMKIDYDSVLCAVSALLLLFSLLLVFAPGSCVSVLLLLCLLLLVFAPCSCVRSLPRSLARLLAVFFNWLFAVVRLHKVISYNTELHTTSAGKCTTA